VLFFQSVENRYKELENEKSLINNRLENDKIEFDRKFKEAEDERQDLLNKNRVKSKSYNRFHSSLIFIYRNMKKI